MKLTVENVNSVKKVLHIEVPREDVVREVDAAYEELRKNAKIKGFRPGKVPRGVLERMFRKDVRVDVTSKLIQTSLLDALRQTELKVVGSPHIDPPELDDKSAYAFDATVEVRPEIADIEFKGLELTQSKYTVSQEELDLQLKMLQRNMARQEKLEEDRTVQMGDVAVIDYEGFKDGQPHEATQKTENFVVKIGEGRVIKDLDEGLVGMRVGQDKEVEVNFPEDYFSKDLAGQKIVFRVRLNEIRQEILPELNDDFARSLGDQFESMDVLIAKIRENLQGGYDKRVEQELNEQVFTKLLAQTDFEVPETLIESELEHILKDAERSFTESNRTFEELGLSREGLAEKYRPVAEKQVRRHLILTKLIEQEKLTVSDDELEKGLEEMAAGYRQPVDTIKAFYNRDPDSMTFFKHTLLEKKALQIILDNGKITEKTPEKKAPEGQATAGEQDAAE
jgi:trigger factor